MTYNTGTEYSEWIPVPAYKYTYVTQIVQGKKFQIRTDKKIDENNYISWYLKPVDSFTFNTASINNDYYCKSKDFTDDDRATKGFFQRAGVLTFLKTSTQLQIWFDDVLEVTWVFEDIAHAQHPCLMKRTMTGLRFISGSHDPDKVSTHYRYGLGEYLVAGTILSNSVTF